MGFEIKVKCTHCRENIAFDSGQLGQTVACPHCQQSTLLFDPDVQSHISHQTHRPAKMTPPPIPHGGGVENQIELVGSIVLWIGILGGTLGVVIGIPMVAVPNSVANGVVLLVAGLVSILQGLVVWSVIRGIAEVVRLLRRK